MKFSLFLSTSMTILLAAAAPNEPSLSELLKTVTESDGVTVLGRDGVLRNLNKARDTVVDYVQLSAAQVAEYTKLYMPPESQALYDDVDGRAVTSEAQLFAVPDFVEPYAPAAGAMTSKSEKARSVLEPKAAECEELTCVDHYECKPYGCNNCLWTSQYCTPGGCINYYHCRDPFE